jgi:hypothetical protein
MRDAVVRLGLQPDALQQGASELKPGCKSKTEKPNPKTYVFDTAWRGMASRTDFNIAPWPDGRLVDDHRKPCPILFASKQN